MGQVTLFYYTTTAGRKATVPGQLEISSQKFKILSWAATLREAATLRGLPFQEGPEKGPEESPPAPAFLFDLLLGL